MPNAEIQRRLRTPRTLTRSGTEKEPTTRAATSPDPTRPKSLFDWRTS
jgi:hypothetical protein